jgi:hypothetical protein
VNATWAIAELFGHRRRAGRVSEVQRFGATMMQIEIPQEDGSFRVELYGGGAIYGVTECTEVEARAMAAACRPRPVPLLSPGTLDAEVAFDDDVPFDDSPTEGEP